MKKVTLVENPGVIAGREVRLEALRLMQERGPRLDTVLLRLRQALNAKRTDIADHRIRLKAAHICCQLYDIMPSDKHEISGPEGGPIILKWPENGNSPT